MSDVLVYFVERVRLAALADLEFGHDVDVLIHDTISELGEVAEARVIERGLKLKPLKESSKIEIADLTICSLAMFFADGGTVEELAEIGLMKLKKWEDRIKVKQNEKLTPD